MNNGKWKMNWEKLTMSKNLHEEEAYSIKEIIYFDYYLNLGKISLNPWMYPEEFSPYFWTGDWKRSLPWESGGRLESRELIRTDRGGQ